MFFAKYINKEFEVVKTVGDKFILKTALGKHFSVPKSQITSLRDEVDLPTTGRHITDAQKINDWYRYGYDSLFETIHTSASIASKAGLKIDPEIVEKIKKLDKFHNSTVESKNYLAALKNGYIPDPKNVEARVSFRKMMTEGNWFIEPKWTE